MNLYVSLKGSRTSFTEPILIASFERIQSLNLVGVDLSKLMGSRAQCPRELSMIELIISLFK